MSAAREPPPIRRLGFIGLGIMGRPMASNLLRAGFPLAVYSRSPGPAEELTARGAAVATSPADVARGSDVVITMLPDTPDVEAVLFGDGGVAEGIAAGSIVADMSTISPSATGSFAARLAELGAEMLDAPVSGGDRGAIAGTLVIMVGGKPEAFERCRPVFAALGSNVVHMGPIGSGQRTKLVNQVIGGLHLVALAEGLAFARAMGLDAERVLEVVASGAAGSWMLTHLGPKAIRGDFAPGFAIRLQRKDLRLALEAMRDLQAAPAAHDARGAAFQGAALAHELFARADEAGLGELGTQALIELYTRSDDAMPRTGSSPVRAGRRDDSTPGSGRSR